MVRVSAVLWSSGVSTCVTGEHSVPDYGSKLVQRDVPGHPERLVHPSDVLVTRVEADDRLPNCDCRVQPQREVERPHQ